MRPDEEEDAEQERFERRMEGCTRTGLGCAFHSTCVMAALLSPLLLR